MLIQIDNDLWIDCESIVSIEPQRMGSLIQLNTQQVWQSPRAPNELARHINAMLKNDNDKSGEV